MCGIVGLYLKNQALQPRLGALFEPMLVEMTSRGPDSAGVAVYRDPAPEGWVKISLAQEEDGFDWPALAAHLKTALGAKAAIRPVANHGVLKTDAGEDVALAWLEQAYPGIRIVGTGRAIEIFKETGLPEAVYARFGLAHVDGTHMIGHTRMATESRVTTAGAHPFATGADLCLVHNGSLSNHNRLRDALRRQGLRVQTENDSEVAAAYMTAKLRAGLSLKAALEAGLTELDGFYTFCIGAQDGFAVLRDPIAAKHAVLAETADWVAMATEYRAIATLPGAEQARIWEPKPQTVYSWGEGLAA